MKQGVKDVQENQTTVEKYEKIFKKSSETKSRRDEESIRKCGTIRDRRVKDVQQGVFNVAYVGQGVKDVEQKGTRVEKIERKKERQREEETKKYQQIWKTWRKCVGGVTTGVKRV